MLHVPLFSAWSVSDFKLLWEEGEKYQGAQLKFDGIPFFVLGTKQLTCHYGTNAKVGVFTSMVCCLGLSVLNVVKAYES